MFHEPGQTPSGRPAILVGVSTPAGLCGNRLIITQKGESECCAALDFIGQHDGEIPRWIRALGLGLDPARPFEGIDIVVEDASPDTCMSLLLLARRITGASVPDKWLKAAREWELGFSPEEPMSSWGAHHNALVHAALDKGDPQVTVSRALVEALAYCGGLIDAAADPFDLPTSFPDSVLQALHLKARSRLAKERSDYRNLAAHAQCAQLTIPLLGSDRRRLVDAMFLVEEHAQGSIKIFARTDKASWTGGGYVFNGYFRPGLPNHDEISFSVAPESGLSLLSLWRQLELLEDAAWGDQRPRDRPRTDVKAFAEGLSHVSPSNDPWWDGGDSHSLIAAPAKYGVPTRLSWEATLSAVWTCFAPGRDVEARRRGNGGQGVALLDHSNLQALAEDLCKDSGLRLLDLERLTRSGEALIEWCPTFEKVLAALAAGETASLPTLPDSSSFEFIRVGTGAAVVTVHGLLLLKADSDLRFPADELRTTAKEVASTLAAAIGLERRLAAARTATRQAIPSGRASARRTALAQLYAIQLRAREQWPVQSPTGGGPVNALREACERRWRAEARFHLVIEEAKELETMISSSSDNRTSTLLNSIALYGFPAALLGNVLGAAFGPLAVADASPWAVAIYAVFWFLALTAFLCFTLLIVSLISRKRWRDAMEADSGSATAGQSGP